MRAMERDRYDWDKGIGPEGEVSDGGMGGLDYYRFLKKFGVDLSLERIRGLTEAFDDPQKRYPVVLVGGTNGKGSVVNMLSAFLDSSGHACGTYLSPHIFSLTERIRVGSEEIPPKDLARLFSDIRRKSVAAGITPTQFEALTLAAHLYFAERGVDIAVTEVGMGGRFDATNVSDPILSVITNVSMDHEEQLGDTVEKIALEKAGICRPHGIVLLGQGRGEKGYEYLNELCGERSAAAVARGREFEVEVAESDGYETVFRLRVKGSAAAEDLDLHSVEEVIIHGPEYQARNAGLALLAAQILDGRYGFRISGETALGSLKDLIIPGRFQTIKKKPAVILDCAHNPGGMASLREGVSALLREMIEEDAKDGVHLQRKVNWVAAFMEDKDIRAMLRKIYGVATNLFLSELPLERSADVEQLAASVDDDVLKGTPKEREKSGKKVRGISVYSRPGEAMRAALANTTEYDILVIAGSIYSLNIFVKILDNVMNDMDPTSDDHP